ncbi:hypothetical protein Poli38472_008202 [Pythium oligandrum]|uniref:F-box domain-containing protein n=1 Tax=Pythium oligandrum TaxID=41045 RepID=A0A8K1CLP7_PYTOL|nr:hypothetical protein Poli38472_008202 [Pythium oligandrum]|eukprot:TMW65560.1 hypothetical protein Poli38472_008202 [Pythium oligandrum]
MMTLGLLPRAGAFVSDVLRQEEQRLMEQRAIFSEVHQVLDEMVYDVETCEYECEIVRLRRELQETQTALAESQQRESELIHERQQAYAFAEKVEQDGRDILTKLTESLGVVMAELAKKDRIELELAQAKEQLQLSAQLSKELASAQREIRELHQRSSIQSLLKTTSTSNKPPPVRIPSPSRKPATTRMPSPPSNQDEVNSDRFADCPDKLLLNVFAYLDANSVFALSLTSRTLMNRVHVIFGVPSTQVTTAIKDRPAKPPSPSPQRPPLKARSQSAMVSSNDKAQQLAKAEMIVKSLKKDEIKLFHDMSTRVRSLEGHLSQTQAEKEDLAARLHSAESVRDFLMEKLQELEDRLAVMMEAMTKKDEQATMDREIIGFLDAKSQEYELALAKTSKQSTDVRQELDRMKEEHSMKMAIIQDMVSLLTDEKKDLEVQLRSQRKVLVREVKTLRAQNEHLVDERDHYFQQLKQLRHALQHLDELT